MITLFSNATINASRPLTAVMCGHIARQSIRLCYRIGVSDTGFCLYIFVSISPCCEKRGCAMKALDKVLVSGYSLLIVTFLLTQFGHAILEGREVRTHILRKQASVKNRPWYRWIGR